MFYSITNLGNFAQVETAQTPNQTRMLPIPRRVAKAIWKLRLKVLLAGRIKGIFIVYHTGLWLIDLIGWNSGLYGWDLGKNNFFATWQMCSAKPSWMYFLILNLTALSELNLLIGEPRYRAWSFIGIFRLTSFMPNISAPRYENFSPTTRLDNQNWKVHSGWFSQADLSSFSKNWFCPDLTF